MIRHPLCALLLVCSGPAISPARATEMPPLPALIAISHGVYCGPEGPTRRLAAPGTELGYIHLTQGPLQATIVTTKVPAVLGLGFGVALRAAPGQADFDAEFRVTHPGPTPGRNVTERWTSRFSADGAALNRFRFEFPHELRTGLWLMEVYRDDSPIFRQAFQVVPPDAAPEILSVCAVNAPLS